MRGVRSSSTAIHFAAGSAASDDVHALIGVTICGLPPFAAASKQSDEAVARSQSSPRPNGVSDR